MPFAEAIAAIGKRYANNGCVEDRAPQSQPAPCGRRHGLTGDDRVDLAVCTAESGNPSQANDFELPAVRFRELFGHHHVVAVGKIRLSPYGDGSLESSGWVQL
jgi:hypothetical protein